MKKKNEIIFAIFGVFVIINGTMLLIIGKENHIDILIGIGFLTIIFGCILHVLWFMLRE